MEITVGLKHPQGGCEVRCVCNSWLLWVWECADLLPLSHSLFPHPLCSRQAASLFKTLLLLPFGFFPGCSSLSPSFCDYFFFLPPHPTQKRLNPYSPWKLFFLFFTVPLFEKNTEVVYRLCLETKEAAH